MLNIKNDRTTGFVESPSAVTKDSHFNISIYDALMFFIGIASALAVMLIAINQFDVPLLLGLGMGLTVTTVILGLKKVIFKDQRFASKTFILILLLAIIFRVGAFTYYTGGQDEGLYVNMSRTLVANRGVNIFDAFRASLPEDLRKIYDSVNYDNINDKNATGILLTDANKSISQIKFYPLNGVWLAIFEAIFGLGKHGYAIQFFSLLVVVGIYFLTLELTTGNRKAATLAMLFAALNPAFVFFSKFPVSETVAMAFSVNGFYLLIKGLRSAGKTEKIFLLVASGLLLGLFNLVRMSFIVFLPTLAVILIAVFLLSDLRKYRTSVSLFVAGVTILYGLSWLYYYLIQPMVAGKTMSVWFIPFLKISWQILVILIIIGITLIWLGSKNAEKVEKGATWIIQKTLNISSWIVPVALLLSILRIIYTYEHNPIFSFSLSNLYNLMLLISPFSFIFLFATPFMKIRFSRSQLIPILTISVTWIALFVPGLSFVGYKYYYTRYLTSEVLLYSIILVSIGLSFLLERGKKYRVAAIITIALTALYSCFFSSVQIGRAETDDPQMYYALNNLVSQNDVIVSNLPASVSLPLKYYFGKNVFQLPEKDNSYENEVLNRLKSSGSYDNVYVLTYSPYREGSDSYGLQPYEKFNYGFSYFTDGLHTRPEANSGPLGLPQFFLPLQFVEENQSVYLYKLSRNVGFDITKEFDINCTANGNLGIFASQGFSPGEPDHTWTDGKTAVLSFQITNSNLLQSDLIFSMVVQGFTSVVPNQHVAIYANSQEVYRGKIGSNYSAVSFPIPAALVRGQDTLEIRFELPDATTSAIDTRVLGLSFKTFPSSRAGENVDTNQRKFSLAGKGHQPDLVLILFILGMWLVVLRPMGPHFSLVPGDLGDGRFNNYILEHFFRSLTGFKDYWNAAFFYPFQQTMAFSDNLLGSAPFYAIFRLAGLDRKSAYQGWFIIGCILNFASASFVLWRLRLKPLAVGAGAFFFAFGLPLLAQETHSQLVYRFCIPLVCFLLWRFYETPRLRTLCYLWAFLVWQFYLTIYLGAFTLLLLIVMIVLLPFHFPAQTFRHRLLLWPRRLIEAFGQASFTERILAPGGIALLCLAMLALFAPYYQVVKTYGFHWSWAEVTTMLPRWRSYLLAGGSQLWHFTGVIFSNLPMRLEHNMFPGLSIATSLLIGLTMRFHTRNSRLAWLHLDATFVLIALTLDVHGFSFYRLIWQLPGLNSIRVITRIILVLMWPLSFFTAWALDGFIQRFSRKFRWAQTIAYLLIGLMVVESVLYNFDSYNKAEGQARLETLKQQIPAKVPANPILYVAINHQDIYYWKTEIDAILLAQELGWPTINGYSGNIPPGYRPPESCVQLPLEIMNYMDFARIKSPTYYLNTIDRTVPIGFSDCDPGWWTQEPTISSSSGPFAQAIFSGLALKVVSLKSVAGLATAQVAIINNSSLPIPALSQSGNPFRLSWRFIRADNPNLPSTFDTRKDLYFDIPAHGSTLETIELAPPEQAGPYFLEVTAVQESIGWFYERGTPNAISSQQLIVDAQKNILVGTGNAP